MHRASPPPPVRFRRLLPLALCALAVPLAGCGSAGDDAAAPEPTPSPASFAAFCEIQVQGIGTIEMETDYLPHVIQCENDGAGPESLRAQAVSARSYAYYKILTSGQVADGTGDQVYSCGKTPEARHYEAAAATAGELLMYQDEVVAAFYVAGADPSDRSACFAASADPDPTSTEQYVTYNEGLAGADVDQTPLGWEHPENWANRGCLSQWGSRCLEERGDSFDRILRFYYGEDIVRARASGPCVDGQPSVAPRIAPGSRRGPLPDRWHPGMRIGG